MKNLSLFLSLSALTFLTACAGGSSSSSYPSTASSNRPISQSQLADLPLNQLMTSSDCIVIDSSSSSKFYITKLSTDSFAFEEDRFANGNTTCSANLIYTEKTTYKASGFSTYQADVAFDVLSLVLVSQEVTAYDQNSLDVLNSVPYFYGYSDWTSGVFKRIDCRMPNNNVSGHKNLCADTKSLQVFKFKNSTLNFNDLEFQ